MNRDEFEKAYADKYTAGDVSAVFANRDFKSYTDHHIDLCWKVQQKNDAFKDHDLLYAVFIEW